MSVTKIIFPLVVFAVCTLWLFWEVGNQLNILRNRIKKLEEENNKAPSNTP